MAFPLRALMGELSYRTVEIPVGRATAARRALPRRVTRVSPVVPAARGQPLVYWRPIFAAGLGVLAIVVLVAIATHSSQAFAEDGSPPITVQAAVADQVVPPAEAPPRVIADEPPRAPEAPAEEFVPVPAPPAAGAPEPMPNRADADAGNSPAPVPSGRVPNLVLELVEKGPAIAAGKKCVADTYQTAVHFARNPAEAARIAEREDKLVFLLHVSGNFEDDDFT